MTEAEWRSSTTPYLLQQRLRRRDDPRKWRLLGVAVCRRVLQLLPEDPCFGEALAVAEGHADGKTTRKDLSAAHKQAASAAEALWRDHSHGGHVGISYGGRVKLLAANAVWIATHPSRRRAALVPLGDVMMAVAYGTVSPTLPWEAQEIPDRPLYEAAVAAEHLAQAALVRDVFRYHARPPPGVNPAWPSWNGGVIPNLARTIYEERAFDQMPILADALEEAGCPNPDILAHCRQPSEHVRGCWLLDLLLGKT
jgi:hypothetical protein